MKLTPKQEQFVINYADPASETFGQSAKSYIKAGYANSIGTDQNASKLLNSDKIQQAIRDYRDKLAAKTDVTRDYVVRELMSVLDACKDGDKYSDRANANAALRLLGQSIAMYTDKVQNEDINAPDPLTPEEEEYYKSVAADLQRRNSVRLSTDTEPNTDKKAGCS